MVDITITPKHLKKGRPLCAWACPVALAIQGQLKKPYRCYISRKYITLYTFPRGSTYTMETPQIVSDFIAHFDLNQTAVFAPFRFKLDIPEKYLKE